MVDTTTLVIRHTSGGLLDRCPAVPENFEVTQPTNERELYIARSVPGVARAERLVVGFVTWKQAGGGDESILVVGSDLNSGLAGPWDLVSGRVEDLRRPDAVIDRPDFFAEKLGIAATAPTVEINGRRARVVGLTQGIRSFTIDPWVFASYPHRAATRRVRPERSNYVIGTLAPDADPAQVRAALGPRTAAQRCLSQRAIRRPHPRLLDVYHRGRGLGAEFGDPGSTGRMVIVAQVLYATTVDHLTEFGTLRAMGAPRTFIYKVILGQAAISATLGYLPGIAVSLLLAKASEAAAAVGASPAGTRWSDSTASRWRCACWPRWSPSARRWISTRRWSSSAERRNKRLASTERASGIRFGNPRSGAGLRQRRDRGDGLDAVDFAVPPARSWR